jgi:hypothetical protein
MEADQVARSWAWTWIPLCRRWRKPPTSRGAPFLDDQLRALLELTRSDQRQGVGSPVHCWRTGNEALREALLALSPADTGEPDVLPSPLPIPRLVNRSS